ncbi:MAG: NUDIX hydrolase [Conexivisphaerales archaeon]
MKERSLLSSRVVYRGRHIAVREDDVKEDGNLHRYEIVEHPGAVAVLVVDEKDGCLIFERQYRYSLKEYLYEIPAGTLEEGEQPERCARRELMEETGYLGEDMRRLVSIRTSPGYTNEILHIFYCRASGRIESRPEVDEEIEVVKLKPKDVGMMVKNGEIVDSKTLAALLVAEALRLVEL